MNSDSEDDCRMPHRPNQAEDDSSRHTREAIVCQVHRYHLPQGEGGSCRERSRERSWGFIYIYREANLNVDQEWMAPLQSPPLPLPVPTTYRMIREVCLIKSNEFGGEHVNTSHIRRAFRLRDLKRSTYSGRCRRRTRMIILK